MYLIELKRIKNLTELMRNLFLVMIELPFLNTLESECSFSNFFIEQLQAFEVWLMFGIDKKGPPQQLPVLLQVLLSQVRVKSLYFILFISCFWKFFNGDIL